MYRGMTFARTSIWEYGAGFTELSSQRIVKYCESINPMVYHESRGPNSWGSIPGGILFESRLPNNASG